MATTIWGYVKADGTAKSGSGGGSAFSVIHDAVNEKGIYYIEFTEAFSDTPAVNVTVQCDDYHSGWWVNALILELSSTKFEVVCVETDHKTLIDTNFSFTATGPSDG